MSDVWVVVANNRTWGKAGTFREALSNMLKESGSSESNRPTMVSILCINTDKPHEVTVSDIDGSVSWPQGAESWKLIKHEFPPALFHAFHGFDIELEDFIYREPFSSAFEDRDTVLE
jgi:hypothetical protein